MIRDTALWEQFEAQWQQSQESSLETNLDLLEVLLQHARSLGVWPPKTPLEGIEHDLLLAKMVNTYAEKPADQTGPRPR